MSEEREAPQTPDWVGLWVNKTDIDSILRLREEFAAISSSFSEAQIKRIFPDKRDKCPFVTYVATPSMIEDFVNQWAPDWQEKERFSLATMLSEMISLLKEAASEPDKIYEELRGYFRALMISNLLYSGWRPQSNDMNALLVQTYFDREFGKRLKRLAKETRSDAWAFFADQKGAQMWTIAQAEVLEHMEAESPVWKEIFHQTQKDLREND